jgi:hypothetical protein
VVNSAAPEPGAVSTPVSQDITPPHRAFTQLYVQGKWVYWQARPICQGCSTTPFRPVASPGEFSELPVVFYETVRTPRTDPAGCMPIRTRGFVFMNFAVGATRASFRPLR